MNDSSKEMQSRPVMAIDEMHNAVSTPEVMERLQATYDAQQANRDPDKGFLMPTGDPD